MTDIKQVIVIRKDLNMRKGKMCAQAAHASLGAFSNCYKEDYTGRIRCVLQENHPMYTWMKDLQKKIVVGIDSETELLDLYYKIKEETEQIIQLPLYLVKDMGLTEFKESTYTCMAIGPYYSQFIDQYTSSLSLL